MATVTESPPTAASADEPFDLTIEILSQMIEAGLIPRDRRVYLRDGRLYEKMAKTKAHGAVGAAITMAIARRLPEGWTLWPESTITLNPTNAPLPHFSVVRAHDPLDHADLYPHPRDS